MNVLIHYFYNYFYFIVYIDWTQNMFLLLLQIFDDPTQNFVI